MAISCWQMLANNMETDYPIGGDMTNDPEVDEALQRLRVLIPRDILVVMPDLIEEVICKTGFGDVRLVIAERRVVRPKQEFSY